MKRKSPSDNTANADAVDIDAQSHNENWIRLIAKRRQKGKPPMPNDSLSTAPWDGSASRYPTVAAYAEASLVNLNTGPSASWTKDKIHLPVREPSGAYNRAALGVRVKWTK